MSKEDAIQLYGQTEDMAAPEAERMTREFLHLGEFLVSVGDVVAYDARYIAHRASANRGTAGAALRPLDRPLLFYGVHLGAGGAELAPPPPPGGLRSCIHGQIQGSHGASGILLHAKLTLRPNAACPENGHCPAKHQPPVLQPGSLQPKTLLMLLANQ